MNWLTFTITTYLLLCAEIGLREALRIGGGEVYPVFLLVLMVFIGLTAAPMTVAWAALILGLLTDLQPTTGAMALPGPAAVGFLVGAYAVVQLRNLLFRESVLTLAIMVFVVGLFVNLAEVAIYSFRGLSFLANEPIPGWSAPGELVTRFLRLLYTAVFALPVGWLLFKSHAWWRFRSEKS